MRKNFLVIVMMLCSLQSWTQSLSTAQNSTAIMYSFNGKFDWQGIEKPDDVLRDKYIARALPLFKNEHDLYVKNPQYYKEVNFKKSFHLVDINNDGLLDMIYTGTSGGEPSEVAVVLNTATGFKVILKRFQFITHLEFKDKKLDKIYIRDPGCCSAYIAFNTIYQVSYTAASVTVTPVYRSANFLAKFPASCFAEPVYFEVLNDNYKMRSSPVVDDDKEHGYDGTSIKGNGIDTLTKGTRGRAIASETDATGRVWWLVEIDPNYKAFGKLFYGPEEDKNFKASRVGWISSRFVKQIEPQVFNHRKE